MPFLCAPPLIHPQGDDFLLWREEEARRRRALEAGPSGSGDGQRYPASPPLSSRPTPRGVGRSSGSLQPSPRGGEGRSPFAPLTSSRYGRGRSPPPARLPLSPRKDVGARVWSEPMHATECLRCERPPSLAPSLVSPALFSLELLLLREDSLE